MPLDFETWISGKRATVAYDTQGGADATIRGLVERLDKAEAQVQRVREACEGGTPYPGGYTDGWHAALRMVREVLDGPA